MRALMKIGLVFGLSVLPLSNVLGSEMHKSGNLAVHSAGNEAMAGPRFRPVSKQISTARGERVFVEHCANCHGMQGKGDGPRSAYFNPDAQYFPDLSIAEYVNGRDKELLASIRDGLARLPEPAIIMPQFKYILSEYEIRSALMYIKSLSKTPARKK